MIYGIGHDLTDIRRIEKMLTRFGARFLERCFADEEIAHARRRENGGLMAATLAKRFAAKEACAKAFGTGFRNGLTMKDIIVRTDVNGCPEIVLSKKGLAVLESKLPVNRRASIHLSLTDEAPYAGAFIVIEID